MSQRKVKAIFVQLGSPRSTKVSDVRSYLREFLSDPRVIDLNPYFWKIILYCFILPFRPKRSAELYSRIVKNGKFPLIENTLNFTAKIKKLIAERKLEHRLEADCAFLLSDPKVSLVWDEWERDLATKPQDAATDVLVVPMFPQFSESTTLSGFDFLAKEIKHRVQVPGIKFLTNFHKSKAFIDHSARKINQRLIELKANNIQIDRLFLTFHGIQKRRILGKKDAYYRHCFETFFLLRQRVTELAGDRVTITFQSRFGSEEWLTPYTEETCEKFVKAGDQKILVYSPSFVADCLETTDELGHELKESVHEWGGELYTVDCLNDDDKWCEDFSKLIEAESIKSLDEIETHYYQLEKEDYKEFIQMSEKELKNAEEPMTPQAKKSLKIVFLTIFLDLLGFSIILPLFPALAKHYLENDSQNYFLNLIFNSIAQIAQFNQGHNVFGGLVLFGGILGAIYSILQFFAAPMWGALSDRIGRRPVLLVSLIGMAVSYVIWFFSGSFTTLIIARVLDGIMGGNISTATAVVADVTTKKNRAKGMAVVGIAFALGFVFGPAIGGLSSLIDLTKYYPQFIEWGLNPFSMPALVAFVLTVINVISVYLNFKETLPPKEERTESERTSNILKIFKPLPYVGVNKVNFSHFLFTSAFSGMEFTLTFLAHERLNFSSMDNAYLFIYIGFIIAFVQGGFVRRKASSIGEKNMAMMGLVATIPGLLLLAFAYSKIQLYAGLFFLAIGSSMIIPCMSSLVTFYTPSNEQGRSIGIYRSLGALARVVGPFSAAIIYSKYNASMPYLLGAAFLLIPLYLISVLPAYKKEEA